MSAILKTAMEDAGKQGYKRWNWGGTWASQTGVYRFKRKWGAVDKRYDYYIQLNDESMLSWSQEKILKSFPGFYVLPFSALKEESTNE